MNADDYKAQGNAAFSAKDFPAAITAFTEAIKLDGNNHILWSNRSAAYASLRKYQEALDDAKKCVSLKPDWAKGYQRLGAAHHGLRDYEEACDAYDKGLQIDPTNASLKESLAAAQKDAQAAFVNPFAKVFNKDCVDKIRANPKIAPYMMHPDFVVLLGKVIEDPSTVQELIKDKRLMHVFMELSGLSIPGATEEVDPEEEAERRRAKAKADAEKKAEEAKKAAAAAAAAAGNPEAVKLKEEGNELYKQRKFDEAMAKYDAALEIEPTNSTFLLNRTAVFFEKGEYETCIAECEKALEHAHEHRRNDYQLVGKLITRQGFCNQKLKRYDDAIALFKKALVEWRNPDTLAKLNACEKEKKVAEEEAYLNPEIAAEKKEEGNKLFKEDKLPQAVECYTESIKRNPKEHTTYSNRAAAYLKLGAYNEALADCEKCIAINPNFVRAHARKGHAYFWTKQYNKALQAYDDGLKLDAANAECIEGKQKTIYKIQEMAQGEGDDDVARRAMSDPEIAGIMNDTYMQLVLSEMQKDPARINEYMKDPGIAQKINKLIAAGIIRLGNEPAGGRKH